MWAVVIACIAATGLISNAQIFPSISFGWGVSTLYHAYLIRRGIPLPFRDIPAWRLFSFSDKRTIIGLYVLSVVLMSFSVFAFFSA